MTKVHFRGVGSDVYALAVWDDAWQSYNNSYLILRGDEVVLIDTGKAEHFQHLQEALHDLGKRESDVTAILVTHGYADHVGNVARFPNAEKHIHPNDRSLLSEDVRAHFTRALPSQGEVLGLTCWLWGDHTAGSCVLHDSASGVTFAGDTICFFGEPLVAGMLVGRADATRDALVSLVAQGDVYRDPRVQPERFRKGLAYLGAPNPKYLATGHGVILSEDLPRFFQTLLASA